MMQGSNSMGGMGAAFGGNPNGNSDNYHRFGRINGDDHIENDQNNNNRGQPNNARGQPNNVRAQPGANQNNAYSAFHGQGVRLGGN